MKFKTYFKPLPVPEKESLAKRCETTVGQLKAVANGYRRAGEKLAINIERETNGKVRCESMRPDVDWAYIRSTT